MPSPELERLAEIGLLEREPRIEEECQGLMHDARATLRDAKNEALSPESRFHLAYSSVHSLALAALRWHGYRPRNRQVVFQALAHTLDMPASTWRMLSKGHEQRNKREYEGIGQVDERLLNDMIQAGDDLVGSMVRLSLLG